MKIGIDARLIHETGVGRYIRNLIRELGEIDKTNSYVVFLRKNDINLPNSRWKARVVDVPWHSFTEQVRMPSVFLREHLDLLHVPYFNVPILYPGKFIVTIHDLTILQFDTGKASTKPYLFYKMRRLGYRLTLNAAISRAEKIIAVSEATKKEILTHFDILSRDIAVTYEGVDENLLWVKPGKPQISGPYFLYVGNAYPHKNIEMLVRAAARASVKLVCVGKDDYFYKRLGIKPIEGASDSEIANLYANARALVFPSRMEGFGLPALEAFALSCPVIASDIPVFRELLGDLPKYFDPDSEDELVACLVDPPVRSKDFIKKAGALVKKYSWRKMAAETLAIYEHCNRL